MKRKIIDMTDSVHRRLALKRFVRESAEEGDLLELLGILVCQLLDSDDVEEQRTGRYLLDAGFFDYWKDEALSLWNSGSAWKEVFEELKKNTDYESYIRDGRVPQNPKSLQTEIIRYARSSNLPIRLGKRGRPKDVKTNE